jgi:gliding motility-associated-like protein
MMRKHLLNIPFLATLACLVVSAASAQVIINEFSASNYTLGVNGDNEDYIEFYNDGPTEVDLVGHWLSDNPDNPQMFEIPAGTTVPAGGYLLIICSNEGEVPENLYLGGSLNTNFKVTQTMGESVVFSDPAGNILESYTFYEDWTPTQADHSWSRDADGSAGQWRVCTNPTPGNPNGGNLYTEYAPTPQFQEESGYYAGGTNVAITAPAGYDIRYTTDGYAPTPGSPLYTGPIAVNETTVIRARCFDTTGAYADSHINTNTYFTGDDNHSIIVVSVSGDEQEDGQWPGGWGGGADEPCHIEFFHPDGTYWCEGSGDSNEHGNDSNAYPQKGFDYITRDQMGHSYGLLEPLFHVKERDVYQRLIFKAAANDNYPSSGGGHIRDAYVQTLSHLADLHVDERTNESCIVYLNGEYWGVYEYREKVDDLDFTTEYYDQPRHFVDFIKTWGGTWVEYGDDADWMPLVNFVTGQDMTDPDNYDYVTSVYNVMSLIDYYLLNSFTVCADWLNWNTAWWRGRHPDGSGKKWRYALWDMDNTFGHGANYTGVPSQGADADPCNPESLGNVGGQGHIPIFNSLMENEDFWATYINRWADLSNTHFSCDNMHAVLDSMINVIEPEMGRHIDRWGGSYDGWMANVDEIHDFIEERCAEMLINGLEDCYEVESVTLTLIIDGMGEVQVNSVDIGPFDVPMDATYFAGVPMELTAEESMGEVFLFWQVLDGDITLNDPTNPYLGFTLNGDATLVAYFASNADPQETTFVVDPPGAGEIYVDGTALLNYPATELLDYGVHDVQAVGLDQWHVFTGWSSTGPQVAPSMANAAGSISVTEPATYTAHFNVIEHSDLKVRVEPPNKGVVRIEGDAVIVTDEWEGGLEIAGLLNADAAPVEHWAFDRWEIANAAPNPSVTSANITLPKQDEEELVAYFVPIDFAVYVPTAFSPNNDGLNDAFMPVGISFVAETYHLIVINRWGEKVFESFDPKEPWIGQHQGGDHFVRDGQYMYRLEVQSVHEMVPRSYTGSVTVVR